MEPGKREPLFAPANTTGITWNTTDMGRLFTSLMHRVSGLHFSPHDCRHTFACRLIWLAEKRKPPDDCAYTDDERRALRDAVFTKNESGRDRLWHLASVLNHTSPETTVGDYVHFLDILLYGVVADSERRLPAGALAKVLECPETRFTSSDHHDRNGFRIERVLPIVRGPVSRPVHVSEQGASEEGEVEAAGEGEGSGR